MNISHSSFVSHPWHGITPGDQSPDIVSVFVEIVPSDTIKYEVDKASGFLKIDRPQKYSNIIPCLYGFIPQTYCDKNIAAFAASQSGHNITEGDKDPLDICVLTSYHIPNNNIILKAIPIGGLRLIDKGEADDKIIAVLVDDEIYGGFTSIKEIPESVINKLRHYFLTYKALPFEHNAIEISDIYDADIAKQVILQSSLDYKLVYGS
jgi:inorganic pyrophosphatase